MVGYGVSDALEIVFDTVDTTRKVGNLRHNARVALVIGWDEAQTLQVEGLADEPGPEELGAIKAVYFAAYPDGVERQRWPGITYVRVRPTWVRYSDYRPGGSIEELQASELGAPADNT